MDKFGGVGRLCDRLVLAGRAHHAAGLEAQDVASWCRSRTVPGPRSGVAAPRPFGVVVRTAQPTAVRRPLTASN